MHDRAYQQPQSSPLLSKVARGIKMRRGPIEVDTFRVHYRLESRVTVYSANGLLIPVGVIEADRSGSAQSTTNRFIPLTKPLLFALLLPHSLLASMKLVNVLLLPVVGLCLTVCEGRPGAPLPLGLPRKANKIFVARSSSSARTLSLIHISEPTRPY